MQIILVSISVPFVPPFRPFESAFARSPASLSTCIAVLKLSSLKSPYIIKITSKNQVYASNVIFTTGYRVGGNCKKMFISVVELIIYEHATTK